MALSTAAAAFASFPGYDYIICGGGTAGLTLAARLTEDHAVHVAILEAGEDRSSDPAVLIPGLASSMIGKRDYDWNFTTVTQRHSAGRQIGVTRGKQLGGSSAMNFLYWTHASQADLNDWEKLGNPGWNWASLSHYMRKSETYRAPPPLTAEALDTAYLVPTDHGKTGPIKTGFYNDFSGLSPAWVRTYQALGLGVDGDPAAGLALGGYSNLANVDLDKITRSFAATQYYNPNKGRPNLHLQTGALVTKVLFDSPPTAKRAVGANQVATGVQYVVNGTTYTARTNREVILSAGVIQSPHILELSGIGNASLLAAQGIDVLIDNPHVGENMQDHALVPLGFEAANGVFTLDQFSRPGFLQAALEQYRANRTGPLAGGLTSSALVSYPQIANGNISGPRGIDGPLSTAEERAQNPGLALQHNLTRAKLLDPREACAQELFIPIYVNPAQSADTAHLFGNASAPGGYVFVAGVVEHPFSRGSVHLASPDPAAPPAIDPNYLGHALDRALAADIALHMQTVAQTQPFASLLKGNGTVYQPGFRRLTRENVHDEVAKNVVTEYHQIGTCAMEPLGKGGVVDERLRVYGTKNVRVVDASVFPLQVRANIQTLVYAVAEKAADIIKMDLEVERVR